MVKPVISTNGTNKVSKLSAILSGIIDVVFIIFMWNFIKSQMDSLPQSMRDDFLQESVGLIVLLIVVAGAMAIYTVYQFAICKTYVDVYEDGMKGIGIQNGYQILAFNLNYAKITNVTYAGVHIIIHTSGGKYKIVSDAITAKKVFDYYNNRE